MIRHLLCTDAPLLPAAQHLAAELSLSLRTDAASLPDETLLLQQSANGLALGQTKRGAVRSSFQIDFLGGKLAHRRRFGQNQASDIVRAVGSTRASVLDATAGFGSDSFALAAAGCTVTLCERHPVVRVLLQDAIARALTSENQEVLDIVTRLTLLPLDAHTYLAELADPRLQERRPDAIYIDPMYPERKKSALVKKEMRWLRSLVGDDSDADDLLHAALTIATERVVVKRMRHDEPLAGMQPDNSVAGKAVRFDVYSINSEK